MSILKKIYQIMVKIEDYCEAKTDSIFYNIKLVAYSSAVLAIVAEFELYKVIPPLSGLPIGLMSKWFSKEIAAVVIFLGVIIGSVAVILAISAAIHIFVKLFRGKKGFAETVAATVVFLVPNLIFGWIPLVNIWTSVYTFLIIVYVLARKQEMTMAQATLVIVIPIILITVLSSTLGGNMKAGMVQSLVPVNFK